MSEHDVSFPSMGSETRLLITEQPIGEISPAANAIAAARCWLEDYERRLSRFRPDSELSKLNADLREAVPASTLLRTAVAAARWAAEQTDGLVDPTLVRALKRSGYTSSRTGVPAACLSDALAAAPPRRAARPHPDALWRRLRVDSEAGLVVRPPGLEVDNGGTGKGLAADAVAYRLRQYARFAVDCGGDVRMGGTEAGDEPRPVEIAHPLSGETASVVWVGDGAVATSGIDVHLWRRPDSSFAHHLLDPSTGEPAWSGLIGASALAKTALEAETLAKAALLAGPAAGRLTLARHGGLLFHDDGSVEEVGLLHPRRRIRVRIGDLRGVSRGQGHDAIAA